MRSLLILPLLLGFSFPANAKSETYYINVSAESIDNYILSGKDKNGSVSGNDPTVTVNKGCLLYTSPSPRDMWTSRMPSSA